MELPAVWHIQPSIYIAFLDTFAHLPPKHTGSIMAPKLKLHYFDLPGRCVGCCRDVCVRPFRSSSSMMHAIRDRH